VNCFAEPVIGRIRATRWLLANDDTNAICILDESLRPAHNLAYESERLFDHACGDIEMGTGSDAAIHHRE
jgi:hypothetical protein